MDKPPPIRAIWSKGGLRAADPYSRAKMEQYVEAKTPEYHIIPKKARSLPHNSKYWAILHQVVEARGGEEWPTPEHLHHQLKLVCGYCKDIVDWDTGEAVKMVDSAAFNQMDQTQFAAYYKLAMQKLGDYLGINIESLGEFEPI